MPNKLKEIKKHTRPWKSPTFTLCHEEVIITRTRIGHSLLTHQHLLSKEDNPTCEYCRSQLSIKHIILEALNSMISFNPRKPYFNGTGPRRKKHLQNLQIFQIHRSKKTIVIFFKCNCLYNLLCNLPKMYAGYTLCS